MYEMFIKIKIRRLSTVEHLDGVTTIDIKRPTIKTFFSTSLDFIGALLVPTINFLITTIL